MEILTIKDCAKAAQLIGAEGIDTLTIAEAHGISETEEHSKIATLRQRLETAKSFQECLGIFNETPSGSRIEHQVFEKLYKNARTQEERWDILNESANYSETRFKILQDIIFHSESKGELIKVYRANQTTEFGDEAIRKLCEIL